MERNTMIAIGVIAIIGVVFVVATNRAPLVNPAVTGYGSTPPDTTARDIASVTAGIASGFSQFFRTSNSTPSGSASHPSTVQTTSSGSTTTYGTGNDAVQWDNATHTWGIPS